MNFKKTDEVHLGKSRREKKGWELLRGKERKIMGKQINQRTTKLVRLDSYWHKILKVDAANAGVSLREFLEACLAEGYKKTKRDYGLED